MAAFVVAAPVVVPRSAFLGERGVVCPTPAKRVPQPAAVARFAVRAEGENKCEFHGQPIARRAALGLATALVAGTRACFWVRAEEGGAEVTTDSGLKYVDIVEGSGAQPKAGQMVKVHYTGRLENGQVFDSSRDRGRPFSFKIGTGMVIKGWDEGVMSMKVGGQRKLTVPPALGYGSRGIGPIPPNSTLIFDVELLSIGG
eukprot:tig00021037_g17411.t1